MENQENIFEYVNQIKKNNREKRKMRRKRQQLKNRLKKNKKKYEYKVPIEIKILSFIFFILKFIEYTNNLYLI